MLKKAYLRNISRIAIFFMVFGALAPSVSHAFFAGKSQQILQQICTTQGIKFTQAADVPASEQQGEHQPALHMLDCLYCTSLGHQDVLPQVLLLPSFSTTPSAYLTVFFAESVPVSASYLNPPPRAPPVLTSF